MPTLRITIKMDNAAFSTESGTEAARILRRLAEDLEGRACQPEGWATLRDLNGNTVGEAKVTR